MPARSSFLWLKKDLCHVAFFALLVVVFFGATTKVHAAGYLYDVPITVTSSTAIASGTQSNFPMLVSSTFPQWKSEGNGGRIQHLVIALL